MAGDVRCKTRVSAWYPALVVLRGLLILSYGYLHPDEFFQSPEIASSDLYGASRGFVPWEACGDRATGVRGVCPASQPPIRSVLFPAISSHAPLYLWGLATRVIGAASWANAPQAAWLVPRVWAWITSIVVDSMFFNVVAYAGFDVTVVSWVWASAWPVLVLFARPLSNTYESFCLVALLRAMLALQNRPTARSAAFGAIFATGLFIRPTFAFYTLPVAIYVAADGPRPLRFWLPRAATVALVAATVTAGLWVAVDSMYYGTFVVTPAEFLKFNGRTLNVARFGLHARGTHVLLNAPWLFGPAVVALVSGFGGTLAFAVGFNRRGVAVEWVRGLATGDMHLSLRARRLRLCLILTSFSGLAVLSASRHQEPRFLLPAMVAVAPLFAALLRRARQRRVFVLMWSLFHAIVASFYAFVHQAGTVPLLLWFASLQSPQPRCLAVTGGLYMPPRALAGRNGEFVFDVHEDDDRGRLAESLWDLLADRRTPCARNGWIIAIGGGRSAVESTREHLRHAARGAIHMDTTPVSRFFPHFSGERLPQTTKDLYAAAHQIEFTHTQERD